MLFKQYMQEVWRPQQQAALARGMEPRDVDVRASMQQHLAPGFLDQARVDIRQDKLGLAHRGLDLQRTGLDMKRDLFQEGKRFAPYATGLGVANVGLSVLEGLDARRQAEQDRGLMQRYLAELRGI